MSIFILPKALLVDNIMSDASKNKRVVAWENLNLIVCCLSMINYLPLHENMFEVLCIVTKAPKYPKCKCKLICSV